MTRRDQHAQFAALETLFESVRGPKLPLPPNLARLYGSFRMPLPRSRFHVFSNFVSTLDGVVSLQAKGHSGGGDISGFSAQDRMLMGLLRAVADVVIVGSGTLAADPRHVWTPQAICPELADDYHRLEEALRKRQPALNVVVSASGSVNLRLPVFASGLVPAMVMTTAAGAKRLNRHKVPHSVRIRTLRPRAGEIPAGAILEALRRENPGKRILIEGGPRLLGTFYSEHLVDEQFLTLAPQIAGRDGGANRPGLVMGKRFAPRDPLWGTLIDARRGSRLLFLRCAFSAARGS
ncbi:MAG TPA: dihydrofolate reductase family protein [Steroidobacteraceae bacterium]|jgi:riboflavin biosynthesis pyrimidine reductase|nr:dihydrofolate reductase family protein [Steroidobacteraceae bacterium]